jgi:predicted transcriptional regulator
LDKAHHRKQLAIGIRSSRRVRCGEIIMTIETLSLPLAINRRIERLAHEAGRTPQEVLKLVLRDGLDYCEYAVKAVNEGLADTYSSDIADVESRIAARRAKRDRKKAA